MIAEHFSAITTVSNGIQNNHLKGYNVAYLDGSASYVKDNSMVYSTIATNHLDWNNLYEVWLKFNRD